MTGMGIYIALSGMRAQQQNIDVTGQNIANASTPGYTRQRTVMEADTPWPVPALHMPGGPGQFGTGVVVKTVERVRDRFLDQQIREQTLVQGQWQQRSDALSQVETTFMELSATGINSALDKFWDAWSQLAKFPDSAPVRTTMSETAVTLADTMRNTYGSLETLKQDLNQEIGLKVDQINDLLTNIAGMNQQIKTVTVSGLSPNDLLDRRDLLIDQLGQVAAASVTVHSDNTVGISIGGREVVQGSSNVKIKAVPGADGINYSQLQLGDDTGNTVALGQVGGELQGLWEARDHDLQGYLDSLDQLAGGLAEAVNNQQMKGYGLGGETGVPFFVGSNQAVTSAANPNQVTSAGSIFVNPYLTEDPSRIAAAEGIVNSTATTEGSLNPPAQQVVTLEVGSNPVVIGSGVLKVTVVAKGLTAGSNAKMISVNVSSGDSAETIISKVQSALSGDSDISHFFNVSAEGNSLVLTANTAATNDNSMSVQIEGLVEPGDNGNALKLAQLENTPVDFEDKNGNKTTTDTINNFYKSIISKLGVETGHAKNMVANQQALVDQLNNRKESISGVNLDEEMANMVIYQNAYRASAKLINVIDEMMQTVIGMGGR